MSTTMKADERTFDIVTERESNAYDSAYAAEYYGLYVETLQKSDSLFYFKALKELLDVKKARPVSSNNLIILDVGCGTGRIGHALASHAEEHGTSLSGTEFIGLDNSPHMLDQAKHMGNIPHIGAVSWVLGTALDLQAVPGLKSGERKVDLLIFGHGNISHLINPGEPEVFLSQVAKVLSPGRGRAYISVDDRILQESWALSSSDDADFVTTDVISKNDPNVLFRDIQKKSCVINNFWIVETQLLVVRKDAHGKEQVVENNSCTIKLRLWNKGELETMIQSSGLIHLETVRGEGESMYVLALSQ